MSRAFVREDANEPPRFFALPARTDPSYDLASAMALLDAARDGQLQAAEDATGYRWGEPQLHTHVRRLLDAEETRPDMEQDRRYVQLARRFLREP